MLKLSLFESLQKRFMPGPLNANELLQRAGFQELLCISSCKLKWQKLFSL